jgi:hypothetical protein
MDTKIKINLGAIMKGHNENNASISPPVLDGEKSEGIIPID